MEDRDMADWFASFQKLQNDSARNLEIIQRVAINIQVLLMVFVASYLILNWRGIFQAVKGFFPS